MALIDAGVSLAAASRRNVWSLWATRVTAILAVLLLIGCNKNSEPSARGSSNKVRIGYIGLTCEAPIFMAGGKGFFKEEGFEAELVRCELANFKEVDAVGDAEPIGSLLMAQGKVRNVADQANDSPYKDEYCCAVLVNGKFLAKDPKAAAAATRALLKAAKWVETNPAAAARTSVEKKYLASNPELNTVAISHLRYVPSVSGAEAAVKSAAIEMKKTGMLSPNTDVEELAKRAFVHLDGVSDEWLQSLQVEKVAGGQVPPDEDIRLRTELAGSPDEPFCGQACCNLVIK